MHLSRHILHCDSCEYVSQETRVQDLTKRVDDGTTKGEQTLLQA